MENQGKLRQWLEKRCKQEHLSLRQAGKRAELSHSTIYAIIKGGHASAQTVTKLARGFGGNGINERLALEDRLLVLADYRSERPEETPSEPLAQLMDKAKGLSESRIKMLNRVADLLLEEG